MSNTKQIIRKCETLINETMKKNQKEIEGALIKPLSPDYPFSTNGIIFLIGRPGSGKSYWIFKHIMITEKLFKHPYYNKIIFCSTSGKADKTAEVLSKNIQTKIDYVTETELMDYLKKHLKRKIKYYAMVKHILTKMKETNEEMQRIIDKHSLQDIDDRIVYIANKMVKYNTSSYPYNTLIILDDCAGSDLLKNGNSEFIRLLTKTRHYNITCIMAFQTIRFVHINAKRMATDIICYSGYSEEDFTSLLQQTNNNLNTKQTVQQYLQHRQPHEKWVANITANKYYFE
ncbi:hypothetical protein M9Y10_039748 [Tritrichomonas musculus]|uniref:AAA+ ATPase domain-containing protein n=1 Tax=Tritrichomonas musculus TaxID=1915356 RepID=A0ABR2GT51_9EUKA